MSTISPESVLEFAKSVEIDKPTRAFESSNFENVSAHEIAAAAPKFDSNEAQAISIGSQIAEFAADFPAEDRFLITNSILLAQLAADKKARDSRTEKKWWSTYVKTLGKLGWLAEDETEISKSSEGTETEVHKAFIPVVSAALGLPTAAATALIVKVLEGLAEIEPESSWINFFSRVAKREHLNHFQIGYVSSKERMPVLSIAHFKLDASRNVTRVLFFSFSNNQADMHLRKCQLNATTDILKKTGDVVKQRVADHLNDSVSAIEI